MTPQHRKRQRLARQATACLLLQAALLAIVIGLIVWSLRPGANTGVIVAAMIGCAIVGMLIQAFYEVRIWPQQNDLRRDDDV